MTASLSHLLALGVDGALYAWCWRSTGAGGGGGGRGAHLRAAELCPDKIVMVASSDLRTSVLTDGGKVASWMDDICQINAAQATLAAEPEAEEEEEVDDAEEEDGFVPAEDDDEEVVARPSWDLSLSSCHQGTGGWEFAGDAAEVTGGSNYCVAVATVPFPPTGEHTCKLRSVRAPENMAIGVVTSFGDLCKHSHTSKVDYPQPVTMALITSDCDAMRSPIIKCP